MPVYQYGVERYSKTSFQILIFHIERMNLIFSSVQFSRSVVSKSLRPHELHHAGPPCPSPTLGVHSDSRPSSQWCHPAISSSVIPFSSCPQSLPASVFSSESTLRMRWPKYWSFSFSIIPSKEHPGLISFRMNWLDLLAVEAKFKKKKIHKHLTWDLRTLMTKFESLMFNVILTSAFHAYSYPSL